MDIIQLVVQFGAVGIAIYLVYSNSKERKEYLKIIGNHMVHTGEYVKDNTKVLTRLESLIEKDIEVNKDLEKAINRK